MTLDIELQSGPLDLGAAQAEPGAGAVVRFEGRVRGEENGTDIDALQYEAYEPMAKQQMEKIARKLGTRHPCLAVRVRHRVGRVAVGEAAIIVEIAARHRGEAFAFLAEFMDELKRDVPIWKAVS